MAITDFERLLWVFAEELERSIQSCFDKVADDAEWVDSDSEAHLLMCRFRGAFVASIVGQTEEKIGRSFSSVFDQLPETSTVRNSKYWFQDMPSSSSPRGRAQVMWAIRVAYTHGNGHVAQIDDPDVAAYLEANFAPLHFKGLRVENDLVTLFGDVTYPAMKTVLEICDKFS